MSQKETGLQGEKSIAHEGTKHGQEFIQQTYSLGRDMSKEEKHVPRSINDVVAVSEGATRELSLKEKLALTKVSFLLCSKYECQQSGQAKAIQILGPEHTKMLCEQPSIGYLRLTVPSAPPALALKLASIAEKAEFEILYYAVTVHEGFKAAQEEFRKYGRMEEQRLRAFEPAVREYDNRHDSKDRRMGFSLRNAIELAREAAMLYVVDGKVESKSA
jgi:hypothetical protein